MQVGLGSARVRFRCESDAGAARVGRSVCGRLHELKDQELLGVLSCIQQPTMPALGPPLPQVPVKGSWERGSDAQFSPLLLSVLSSKTELRTTLSFSDPPSRLDRLRALAIVAVEVSHPFGFD